MKKLAVIGYVWPEPNSSAAGQNMLALLNLFKQQDWKIDFLCPANDSTHAQDVKSWGIDTHTIDVNDSHFDELIHSLQPDVVVFDRFMMEEQFSWRVKQTLPNTMRILNTEDLHSLRDARYQAFKQTGDSSNADLHSDMAQREVAAILRSDLTLILSPAEQRLLIEHYQVPQQQLCFLPLPMPESPALLPDFSDRQHFVTIGNFRHQPNWDATLLLREKLWPQIRKRLPDAELHIYGGYPAKKVTALHNDKLGFLVKGWVVDAQQAIADSRVLLAPLRFGAGVKGKLLSAMAAQTPSVTTDIGAEGITTPALWPGAVHNQWDAFIDAAVELYSNPAHWHASVAKIPQACEVNRQYAAYGEALIQRVEQAIDNINGYRQPLFLQGLLWHHSLRATQFMSQWIETKNKLAQYTQSQQ